MKNESKILTKDTSCECKCRFDEKTCNSHHWWNHNVSVENVKYVKKIIFGNLLHVVVKMDDSAVTKIYDQ